MVSLIKWEWTKNKCKKLTKPRDLTVSKAKCGKWLSTTLANSKHTLRQNQNLIKAYRIIIHVYFIYLSKECYIISVMQALFTTGELQPILEQYYSPKWTALCYHIKELFNSLKSANSRCNVDYVKRYGPLEFA